MKEYINPYTQFHNIPIPCGVFNIKRLHIMPKVMYGLLTWHAGPDGECYPKQQTLADELGITRKHVNRLLDILKKEGLIERIVPTGKDRYAHKSTRYLFLDHPCFIEKTPCVSQDTSNCVSDDTPKESKNQYRKKNIVFIKNNKNNVNHPSTGEASSRKESEVISRRACLDKNIQPLHKELPKKDIKPPLIIKQYLDCWNNHPVRKHLKQNTIAYAKAVDHLRMLIRGQFFDKLPVDDKYKQRKFTLQEFEQSLDNFSEMITNILVYPKKKDFIKSMSVSDFLYNTKSVCDNKSYFLICLESEPKKIEIDSYPDLTNTIIKMFKSVTGNGGYVDSQVQMDKFMMASRRLHNFFKVNGNRLNGTPYNDKKKVTALLDCVLSDIDIHKITPGWLCSNETFNRRLPDYCEEYIWPTRRQRIRRAI